MNKQTCTHLPRDEDRINFVFFVRRTLFGFVAFQGLFWFGREGIALFLHSFNSDFDHHLPSSLTQTSHIASSLLQVQVAFQEPQKPLEFLVALQGRYESISQLAQFLPVDLFVETFGEVKGESYTAVDLLIDPHVPTLQVFHSCPPSRLDDFAFYIPHLKLQLLLTQNRPTHPRIGQYLRNAEPMGGVEGHHRLQQIFQLRVQSYLFLMDVPKLVGIIQRDELIEP